MLDSSSKYRAFRGAKRRICPTAINSFLTAAKATSTAANHAGDATNSSLPRHRIQRDLGPAPTLVTE